MGSKALLCCSCGHFSPPEEGSVRRGRMVDTQDGEGFLWTCEECTPKSVTEGKTPVYKETPPGFGDD